MAGGLAAVIRAATARVVPRLLEGFAEATVTIYADDGTGALQPDNTRAPHWRAIMSGVSVPWFFREISESQALRDWGTEELAQGVALMASGPGFPDVRAGHAIVVDTGDRAGQAFRVLDHKPSDLGSMRELAVRVTREEIP